MKGTTFKDGYDGSIELRKVVFSYPSRPQDIIFRDFNLKIEPGQAVALVGPSGSGKSSLSKLLLRLYDPIGGRIFVGGVGLSEINLKWWRSQIGYVCQEPCFFPGSVRDNIAAGKVDGKSTDEEVEAAARAASAHDFIINLPHGYSTFYSGSSTQLSGKLWCFIWVFHFSRLTPTTNNLRCVGGQMQRISIARALIRHPKVLLLGKWSIFIRGMGAASRMSSICSHPIIHTLKNLDEATSALDTASGKLIVYIDDPNVMRNSSHSVSPFATIREIGPRRTGENS